MDPSSSQNPQRLPQFRAVPSEAEALEAAGAWCDHDDWALGPAPIPVPAGSSEIPLAKYPLIVLSQDAKARLRLAFRTLWPEGVVQAAITRKAHVPPAVVEAMRLYCVEELTLTQIGKSIKGAGVLVSNGFQLALAYMEPRRLRDELVKVVLGERLPLFTQDEVKAMFAEERRRGKPDQT